VHRSSNSRQNLRFPVSIAALAAAAALAVSGCGKQEGAPDGAMGGGRPPAAVTVTPAVAKDVPIYLDQIGRAVSVENVNIVPQVGGQVTAVHVQDGQDVKKDDLLFEIDARPYKAAVASAKASMAQRRAELELAKLELKRLEQLRGTPGAVSQQEIDQRTNAVAVGEANVEAAQAQLETAELNVGYTRITAPTGGRAGAVLVDVGNVVEANKGTLLNVQKLDPIYAEFTITENELGTVRKYVANRGLDWAERQKGLKVLVDIPADSAKVKAALGGGGGTNPAAATQPTTAPAQAGAGGGREGTLTFLDNAVQDGSGTVRLRATLPNEDRYFWPGQFLNCRLVLAVKKDAVLIPAMAQQIGQQGPYVYVTKSGPGPDGKPATIAEIRPIVPGQRQGDMIVVDQGLAAGDQVVITGQMMIMPGGPVMVIDPNQQPQGAQASAAQ